MPTVADEVLEAGRMSAGVVRRDATVRRPMGSWSPGVHAFLRRLEAVGFAGSPRVLGVDGDTEVLTFLPGEVPIDPEWQPGQGLRLPAPARSTDALVAAARLLRELHTAAAGFDPRTADFRFHPHRMRAGEVMTHGDLGPWNTVYRDGLPAAFIDWDACRPLDPVVDLAMAAWEFVPLESDRVLAETGFDPLPDIAERLRAFVDAYGVADRTAVLPALQEAVMVRADRVRYWGLGPTDTAVAMEFHATQMRWLGRNSERLARALR
jgi:Ser/Thr protein kinase RdoA (MazF antagonist)